MSDRKFSNVGKQKMVKCRLLFSSIQSLDRLGRRGDMRDDSAEILFKSFLQEALVSILALTGMSTLWHFSCGPSLQDALENGFGEVVVVCDIPGPCKFPSLDSCQERLLLAHKDVDLAPHPVLVWSSR